jgi:hypothetical protein
MLVLHKSRSCLCAQQQRAVKAAAASRAQLFHGSEARVVQRRGKAVRPQLDGPEVVLNLLRHLRRRALRVTHVRSSTPAQCGGARTTCLRSACWYDFHGCGSSSSTPPGASAS